MSNLEVFIFLKEVRKGKGLNLENVSEILNKKYNLKIDQSNLSRYEAGKVKKVDPKIIKAICEIYEVDYTNIFKKLGFIDGIQEDRLEMMQIPLFSCIAAGCGKIPEDKPIDYILIPKISGDIVAVIVKGDSMSPKISDGDYIILERESKIEVGDVGVFIINREFGDAVVKRLVKKDKKYILESDNKEYQDIEYNSDFICCGKVRSVIKNNLKKHIKEPIQELIDSIPENKREKAIKMLKLLLEE